MRPALPSSVRSVRLAALGLLAATVFAGSATAKEPAEVPRWRRTYAEALLEARLRNVPVWVSRQKDG